MDSATIDAIKSYMTSYNESTRNIADDEWKKFSDLLTQSISDRFETMAYQCVKVISIDKPVVNAEIAEHCLYVNNHYIGQVYIDESGKVYGSLSDIKNAYGSRVVFINEQIYNHCEIQYCEELDALIIASRRVRWYNKYHENDNLMTTMTSTDNEQIGGFDIGSVSYGIITKTLECYNTCYKGYRGNLNNYDWQGKPINLMNAAKKLFGLNVGVVNVGGNKYIPLDTIENLQAYVSCTSQFPYKKGKMQQKIDELVNAYDFKTENITKRLPHQYNNLCSKTIINKIRDDLCVIRWTYNYQDESFDGMRIYIEDKEIYACKRNNAGQFVRLSISNLNQKHFKSEYGHDIEISDMSGTVLQYYASIINEIPEDLRIVMLTLFICDNRIEQFVKLGVTKPIYWTLVNKKTNLITAIVNDSFGNKDGKNAIQTLGLNKHQFNTMLNYCKTHSQEELLFEEIGYMKKLFFGDSDIACVDNKLFDSAIQALEASNGRHRNSYTYWAPNEAINQLLTTRNNIDPTGVYRKNLVKYLPTLYRMTEWSSNYIRRYADFIMMVDEMGISQQIKLYPQTLETLISAHDQVSDCYNLHKNAYEKKAFMEHIQKLDTWEYQHDDFDFCVVAPTSPEDLTIEGIQLSHCVKSYISKVARGQTNIMFIRKKDDITKPFFTVEVTNNRVISQVHGFANRNADTEPNMIEFVQQWARSKRLKIGAINHCA